MDLAQKLERLLADLGDSPEAVAAFLEGQGIRGQRMQAGHCPVAVYVKRTVGAWMVAADCASVGVVQVDHGRTHGWVRVDTPEPVAEFINAFDRGGFPTLAEEGPHASV